MQLSRAATMRTGCTFSGNSLRRAVKHRGREGYLGYIFFHFDCNYMSGLEISFHPDTFLLFKLDIMDYTKVATYLNGEFLTFFPISVIFHSISAQLMNK